MDLKAAMAEAAGAVEAEMARLLPADPPAARPLLDAMRYGVMGGGKRLRPFLVHAFGSLLGADPRATVRVGAALELVHGYSLIHDDLPAMDDAALRRGRPTVHRAFDEATAILAGDALLTLAFDVLARDDWPAATPQKLGLVRRLAEAAGAGGMCGGQMIDLLAEKQALDLARIVELQDLKTGRLIVFGCEAGALLADRLDPAVSRFGASLGLAFQIKDDLLDVEGEAALAGKDLGRDEASGKATFVTLLGAEGARTKLEELADEGAALLETIDGDTTLLEHLVRFVIHRHS